MTRREGRPSRSAAERSAARVSRRAVIAIVLPVVLPAVLTACSSTPLDNYDLSAIPASVVAQRRPAAVTVEEPSAAPLLASNRIVIRRAGSDYAFLAGAQWSDQLPQLVQRRIIESFESAKLFGAVAETGTAADYILAMDIRRFDIDGESSRAMVEIAVRLVAARTGRTLRGTVVSGSAAAPASGATGITAALDQAFGEAAGKILKFAVSRT